MADIHGVFRKPENSQPEHGFFEHPCNRQRPDLTKTKQVEPTHPVLRRFRLRGNAWDSDRVLVKDEPARHPDEAERTGYHKGLTPSPVMSDGTHQRARHDRAYTPSAGE